MTKKWAAALSALAAILLLSWLVPKLSDREYSRPGLSTVEEVVGVIQGGLRPGAGVSQVAAFAEKYGMEAGELKDGKIVARIRYARESGPQKTIIVIQFVFDGNDRLADYTIKEEYETL